MAIVLIGIDDTDNLTSTGTGRTARRLADVLALRGAKVLGVTRHQFLVDRRIPYTSHNSGACIAIEWNGDLSDLKYAGDLLKEWSAVGSDPGICMAKQVSIPKEVCDWGLAATEFVLTMPDAQTLAQLAGVYLKPLGGTGGGIIGALASVGLHMAGNNGRFLFLPGLRELGEFATPNELARLGISIDHQGSEPSAGAIYRTLDWVRPRLVGGKPVWPVKWSDEYDAWIPVDQKKQHFVE